MSEQIEEGRWVYLVKVRAVSERVKCFGVMVDHPYAGREYLEEGWTSGNVTRSMYLEPGDSIPEGWREVEAGR